MTCLPDRLIDIIGSRPVSELCGVTADALCPLVGLEEPHSAGEKTSTDKVQQATRSDNEVLDLYQRTTPDID